MINARKFFAIFMILIIFSQNHIVAYGKGNSNARLRYRVNFNFKYINDQFQPFINVETINFDTGERIQEEHEFEDKELTPLQNVGSIKEEGQLYMSSSGLKAYAIYRESGGYGGTIYEFNLSSLRLKKIKDVSKNKIILYPSLGIYSEEIQTPVVSGRFNTTKKYYAFEDNSLRFKEGTDDSLIRINNARGTCSPNCTVGDYILERNIGQKKGVTPKFLVSFGGKLTPIKRSDITYSHDNKMDTETILVGSGKVAYTRSITDTKEQSTLIWLKGDSKKTLIQGEGYINTVTTPSVSPNKHYMLVAKEIRGKGLSTESLVFYIFDIQNNMKLIQKFNAKYRLKLQDVEWHSDNLLKIKHSSSMPAQYPAYYYNILNGSSTISNNQNDWLIFSRYEEDDYYWDSFSYEGLSSLNEPLNSSKNS